MMNKNTAENLFYPFFFALFPVLSLWAQNVEIVTSSQVVRSLIVAFLFEVLLLGTAWLAFRNLTIASLMAAFVTLLVFSYGRMYDGLQNSGVEWARHRILLPIVAVFLLAWAALVLKWLKNSPAVVSFFNVSGFVLIIMPLITIVAFGFSHRQQLVAPSPVQEVSAQQTGLRPDIYYIILDAYGRQDMLNDIYGLDNSAFIARLQEHGFYIAGESRSNYRQTLLSLPSSLNMDYLQNLIPDMNASSTDRTTMTQMIWHSQVRQLLAEQGYRYVAIDNGYRSTAEDADLLLSGEASTQEQSGFAAGLRQLELNEYEGLLIGSSIGRLWVDWQVQQGGENVLELIAIEAPYNRHREQVLFVAHSAAESARLPGDNFVFIHILIPHPPFVFDSNGEPIKHTRLYSFADGPASQGTREEYLHNYPNQLLYANQLVSEMIDRILADSDTPPIIILQGDHGPRAFAGDGFNDTNMYESFSILNAYYFPERDYELLYPSISPVNSFRVIFNQYFDANLALLPDLSYYSSHGAPFDLKQVNDFQP